MRADFFAVWLAAGLGLLASIGAEMALRPRPRLARPWAAWALHGGLWFSAHAVLTAAFARPWFAAAVIFAALCVVVLVNNAKFRALREPFVFQDFDYFTDAIRHPRLYLPFLGWGKFLAAAICVALAAAVGLAIEAQPKARFALSGQLGALLLQLALGFMLMTWAARQRLPVSFEAERGIASLGLVASLWRYAREEKRLPVAASPWTAAIAMPRAHPLPHLVAVQSESFFDPRALFTGIRRDVLAEFDMLKAESAFHGRLHVPAWGANTVRSEFAFLTGLTEEELGVHRFNPYRAVARGWEVSSLASYLKRLGYRTLAVHPYPASFYLRDRVYPRLGFDEFIDLRAFAGAERFGPYIADRAVAEQVADILQTATDPVFIFVVTMENHGPLHLEQAHDHDIAALYEMPPPPGCEDLTIYLRHLRNADRMLAPLRAACQACERPASLCWYGDHVPIMPKVYAILGEPSGQVDYVLWNGGQRIRPRQAEIPIHLLGAAWLREVGVA